jgi:hypothetical protein
VSANARCTFGTGLAQAYLRTISANLHSGASQQSVVFLASFFHIKLRITNEKSYVLKVADSDLASDYVDYRKLHYPEFPLRENTHFVVTGHDIYHEILATSFDAITIPKAEITDTRLLRLVADE